MFEWKETCQWFQLCDAIYVIRHILFVYMERFGNYTDKRNYCPYWLQFQLNRTRHTKLKTNYSCDND